MGGEPAFGVVAKATSWFGLIDYTNSCALAPSGAAHFEHARREREKKENRLGDRGEGMRSIKKKKKKKKRRRRREKQKTVLGIFACSWTKFGLLVTSQQGLLI